MGELGTGSEIPAREGMRVGVRDLRQNLSRFLLQVKEGRSFVVTEHGREVARLTPSGPVDSPIARLVAERGATLPQADLLAISAAGGRGPAGGPPSEQVLAEMREERL
jgi:prevent-host-death family protein